MSKKKRFGISEALTRGLSETINVVENNLGVFRNVILPLSRIELDPDNPRKLALTLADIKQGLETHDPDFHQKHDELTALKEMAHTILTNGIINPIVVYKLDQSYRIAAGERRYLSSIIAGKKEIEARVFSDKPKPYDLKLIQWIENTAREDLTLNDRLGNIRDIIYEYQKQHGEVPVTATLLKEITGLSLSQTTYYLTVLNAPQDLQQHIMQGRIRNLDKAAFLAGIDKLDLREQATLACIEGASLKVLRQMVTEHKRLHKQPISSRNKQGRATQRINMGTTLNPAVVKTIIDCVINQNRYTVYRNFFAQINWQDQRAVSFAFKKLIHILENEVTTQPFKSIPLPTSN